MILHLKRIAAVTSLLSALGSNPASAQVRLHGVWRNRCVYTRHVSRWECRGGYSERERGVPNPSGNQAFRWTAAGGAETIGGHMGYGFCGRRARCSGNQECRGLAVRNELEVAGRSAGRRSSRIGPQPKFRRLGRRLGGRGDSVLPLLTAIRIAISRIPLAGQHRDG
jgi:hypothetical protein